MAIEVKIPHVGESITEVQIAEWLKADGDEVKKDENIAVIDSEKTTLELPASENGRLKILHQAGDTVKIGGVVAQIETSGAPEKVNVEKSKSGVEAEKAKPQSETVPDIKEAAEKPARQVETKKEKSETRSGKKVVVEKIKPVSVESTKQNDSGTDVEKVVPMTMLRKTAAKRLVEAKQQMAMLTTFNEVDMGAIQNLRKQFQERFEKKHQTKLGFMSFFVKAVVGVLREFSQLNAEIRGNDIVYLNRFDIGVAIASERGLVVPVLREADLMSFAEIEKAIGDFAKRAKEGKLKPEELEGGTFTITNGGVFGSLLSTPIINPPQTGILGMHATQERPVALNGQVIIRPMMYLALTYDHRLVDGREAVLFLRSVKETIENPARMAIDV